jgi:hypothetical protein
MEKGLVCFRLFPQGLGLTDHGTISLGWFGSDSDPLQFFAYPNVAFMDGFPALTEDGTTIHLILDNDRSYCTVEFCEVR